MTPGDLKRKLGGLARDPVLRRWLLGRVLGRYPGAPSFRAHRPDYAEPYLPLAPEPVRPPGAFAELDAAEPERAMALPLPGRTLTLAPGDAAAAFEGDFPDLETELALHRFAWLPLLGDQADPAWVGALWRAWSGRFGTPSPGWAWHPYTAAERAVNLLAFARRQGLPGPLGGTLACLAAHGPAIARRLEYFGDHHTSNHLANNGRGLYLLGLELGMENCTRLGAAILMRESARIFSPSGLLREGSSHYHLLLTRNYFDVWFAARRHRRPETQVLGEIVGRALVAARILKLSGGFPLIGDISPDCPPDYLEALAGGAAQGWISALGTEESGAVSVLGDVYPKPDPAALAADGWLRAGFGSWDGIWHAAPGGLSHMPGHGHQDCGSFELHFQGHPVFVDPGRGSYAPGAADDVAGAAQNTLLVDGRDPYPPNKPYYDTAFRRRFAGPPPRLTDDAEGVTLTHSGFCRLGSVGAVTRRWEFSERRLTLTDRVEGNSARAIARRLHTPLNVSRDGDGLALDGPDAHFRLAFGEATARLDPATLWRAYGEGRPGTVITLETRAELPVTLTLTLEADH